MDKNLLKLHKIIKCSNIVKNLRKSIGLKNGEYFKRYIVGFVVTTLNKKIPILKSFAVQNKVQKQVIDYFGIESVASSVINGIFWGDLVLKQFLFIPRINNDKRIQFTVVFDEMPTKESLDYLMKQINYYLNSVNSAYKNHDEIQGISTKKCKFERIKTVDYFDEKFEISKKYKLLIKQYHPKKIPSKKMNKLLIEAKKMLQIKAPFNVKDLRKHIEQFDKYFEG